MIIDWRDPEQLRAAAAECRERTRREQGLPPCIENEALLDQLAALIDIDPPSPAPRRMRGAA